MKSKTRILAFIMTLCMLIGILPVTVSAGSSVFVGSYSTSKFQEAPFNEGTWRYDSANSTLYLNGYRSSDNSTGDMAPNDSNQVIRNIYSDGDLTIVCKGDNNLQVGSGEFYVTGIHVRGTLTIKGDGTLTINGGKGSSYYGYAKSTGIVTGGNCIIEGNVKVNINLPELTTGQQFGIRAGTSGSREVRINDNAELTIKNGDVEDGDSYGIQGKCCMYGGKLDIEDGKVTDGYGRPVTGGLCMWDGTAHLKSYDTSPMVNAINYSSPVIQVAEKRDGTLTDYPNSAYAFMQESKNYQHIYVGSEKYVGPVAIDGVRLFIPSPNTGMTKDSENQRITLITKGSASIVKKEWTGTFSPSGNFCLGDYTCKITLKPKEGYKFTKDTTAHIAIKAFRDKKSVRYTAFSKADDVTLNNDGTLTVTVKYKLTGTDGVRLPVLVAGRRKVSEQLAAILAALWASESSSGTSNRSVDVTSLRYNSTTTALSDDFKTTEVVKTTEIAKTTDNNGLDGYKTTEIVKTTEPTEYYVDDFGAFWEVTKTTDEVKTTDTDGKTTLKTTETVKTTSTEQCSDPTGDPGAMIRTTEEIKTTEVGKTTLGEDGKTTSEVKTTETLKTTGKIEYPTHAEEIEGTETLKTTEILRTTEPTKTTEEVKTTDEGKTTLKTTEEFKTTDVLLKTTEDGNTTEDGKTTLKTTDVVKTTEEIFKTTDNGKTTLKTTETTKTTEDFKTTGELKTTTEVKTTDEFGKTTWKTTEVFTDANGGKTTKTTDVVKTTEDGKTTLKTTREIKDRGDYVVAKFEHSKTTDAEGKTTDEFLKTTDVYDDKTTEITKTTRDGKEIIKTTVNGQEVNNTFKAVPVLMNLPTADPDALDEDAYNVQIALEPMYDPAEGETTTVYWAGNEDGYNYEWGQFIEWNYVNCEILDYVNLSVKAASVNRSVTEMPHTSVLSSNAEVSVSEKWTNKSGAEVAGFLPGKTYFHAIAVERLDNQDWDTDTSITINGSAVNVLETADADELRAAASRTCEPAAAVLGKAIVIVEAVAIPRRQIAFTKETTFELASPVTVDMVNTFESLEDTSTIVTDWADDEEIEVGYRWFKTTKTTDDGKTTKTTEPVAAGKTTLTLNDLRAGKTTIPSIRLKTTKTTAPVLFAAENSEEIPAIDVTVNPGDEISLELTIDGITVQSLSVPVEAEGAVTGDYKISGTISNASAGMVYLYEADAGEKKQCLAEAAFTNGSYEFTGVLSGEYIVVVQANAYEGSVEAKVTVDGDDVEKDFELQLTKLPSVTITGKVDSYGEDAEIRVVLASASAESTFVTQVYTIEANAEDDVYEFADVPTGTYTITVSKPNHVTRTYTVQVVE